MVPLALSLIDHLATPLEDRLIQELSLVDVAVTAVRRRGFAEDSLEQRIDWVRKAGVASPVAWLTIEADLVQVSIASVDASRANIRLVAVPPGPDAVADLALGVREILAQLAVPPPPSSVTPPDLTVTPRVGLGIVSPTRTPGLGPRAILQAEASIGLRERPWLRPGVLVAVQAGRDQWRVGLGAVGRLGPGLLAARLDVVGLPWVTWLQPRLDLGVTVEVKRFWAESRLSYVPRRDVVEVADELVYDSGRLELAIVIGLRQMPAR